MNKNHWKSPLLWSKFIQFQGFIEKALQDLKNNSEEIINGKT